VALVLGSVSVGTTATLVPLAANSPGSLVLVNSGPDAITLGGSGITTSTAGPGSATIPAGAVVLLAKLGNLAQGGCAAWLPPPRC
jgi:hypothetical protein